MQTPALSRDSAGSGMVGTRDGFWQLVAPGAILSVPFFTYAVYLRYPLLSLEFLAALGFLFLLGGLCGLLIVLRPRILAPVVLPLIVFLAADLQLGVEGLLAVLRGDSLPFLAQFGKGALIVAFGAFALMSLLIMLAGRKTPQIIFAVSTAMVLSTLFFGQRLPEIGPPPAQQAVSAREDLPAVIYLIFDEHGGLAGMPPEYPETAAMAESLKRFYDTTGFRRFENAMARYDETLFSISDLLAEEAPTDFGSLADPHKKQHALESNRLFGLLAELGYQLKVYQSDFFDFCSNGGSQVESCHIYQRSNVVDIRATDLDALQRAQVLLLTFASRSLTYQTLYRILMASAAAESPQTPPRQRFRLGATPNFGVIPSLEVLDDIAAALKENPRGVAYFAHLLTPHRTFLLDETCAVSWPLTHWHLGYEPLADDFNSPESRRAGYYAYNMQLACLYEKLTVLLETIDATPGLEDAIVVFQGDHGTRISKKRSPASDDPDLTEQERLDSFSALFAVRAPSIRPGIDKRQLALRDILTETIEALWPGRQEVAPQGNGPEPAQ